MVTCQNNVSSVHQTLIPLTPETPQLSENVQGYALLGGGKRKSTKVVRGATFQSRPSASYHYNTLRLL